MSSSPFRERAAELRAEVARLNEDVASHAGELGADELFELAGDFQGIVNAAEGGQLVVSAHAASHEHRLTSRGLVEARHDVGFVDAMAPSEVALATGTTVGVAGHRVQLGADLTERFPLLLEAVVSGSVATGTARKVVSACEGLDARECGLVEAVLVERLPDLDPARVTTVARRVASRVAPQRAAAAQARNRRGRGVEVSPGPDGTTTWWATLPAAQSAVAWSAVTTLAEDYRQGDPSLTVDQARADAMVDLMLRQVTVSASVTLGIPVVTDGQGGPVASGQPASGAPSTPIVPPADRVDVPGPIVDHEVRAEDATVVDHVTGEVIAVTDLAPASRAQFLTLPDSFGGLPTGCDGIGATVMAPTSGGVAVSGCEIPRIGWIEATTVAAILSTVPLVMARALLDRATGTVVETTTPAYRPTRAIRAHVALRDGTCRMWGCTRPAETLDLDHTRPWPAGATNPANLAGLCRRHHRMKQQGRWRYSLEPDGSVVWVSTSGQRRVTHADHALWPPPAPSQDTRKLPALGHASPEPHPGRTPDRGSGAPPF